MVTIYIRLVFNMNTLICEELESVPYMEYNLFFFNIIKWKNNTIIDNGKKARQKVSYKAERENKQKRW